MSLTMQEKKLVIREYAQHYRNANKKLKSKHLDGFVDLTGYRRDYTSFILRNWGRNVHFSSRVVVVGEELKRRCYIRQNPVHYQGCVKVAQNDRFLGGRGDPILLT